MPINKITGEVIEIPNELEEAKNNQIVADMVTDAVLDMYAQFEYLKEQKETFEWKVREACQKYGVKKVENQYFSITYIPAHTSKRVDTELLKKAGIYDDFCKESEVKESVRVKMK